MAIHSFLRSLRIFLVIWLFSSLYASTNRLDKPLKMRPTYEYICAGFKKYSYITIVGPQFLQKKPRS